MTGITGHVSVVTKLKSFQFHREDQQDLVEFTPISCVSYRDWNYGSCSICEVVKSVLSLAMKRKHHTCPKTAFAKQCETALLSDHR